VKSKIDILIVGGCFPVQSNIPKEKLYHQILKDRVERELCTRIEIKILQYEKLAPTFDRIKEIVDQQSIDLIIFHIRIEQILRMIKLYLRYYDKNEVYHKGLNLAVFGTSIPERKDFNLHHSSRNSHINRNRFSNRYLKNINYILGYVVLNQVIAFRSYKRLITSISKLCETKSLDIIFTCPVSRPANFIENLTSIILSFYMRLLIVNKLKKTCLKLLGLEQNSQYLFCEDHIKVNESGHQRIANIIFNSIKIISKHNCSH
jgi:hypothetical protein